MFITKRKEENEETSQQKPEDRRKNKHTYTVSSRVRRGVIVVVYMSRASYACNQSDVIGNHRLLGVSRRLRIHFREFPKRLLCAAIVIEKKPERGILFSNEGRKERKNAGAVNAMGVSSNRVSEEKAINKK